MYLSLRTSSEVEYVAAISTACQTILLQKILIDLQEKQDEPIKIYYDNKSTIMMMKNSILSFVN